MWKDSIQRLFRYRKITPSPTLWEQLEAQLAESEAQQARHKSRKVWYYAIAVCLLLCLGIGYLLQQPQTNTSPEYQSHRKRKRIICWYYFHSYYDNRNSQSSHSPKDSYNFASC